MPPFEYIQTNIKAEINKEIFIAKGQVIKSKGWKALYDKEIMTGRGKGKYMYKNLVREDGKKFLREQMKKYFPNNEIMYIV